MWVVVQPEGDNFRVAIANKFGVRPFGPPLPSPAVFTKDQLGEFLLTKRNEALHIHSSY